TCPLVTKVHVEAKRFARGGRTIFLIGHVGHEEIEGTAGEAPDQIVVIEGPEDVERAVAPDPGRVAYLTQTTLAVDATVEVFAPSWIEGAEVIGLSSGPSTSDVLVERVVAFLTEHGFGDVEELKVATEDVHFPLPAGLD